jgi:hypothetical protein
MMVVTVPAEAETGRRPRLARRIRSPTSDESVAMQGVGCEVAIDARSLDRLRGRNT